MTTPITMEELAVTVTGLQQEVTALRRDVARLGDIHAVRTLHFKYGYFQENSLLSGQLP